MLGWFLTDGQNLFWVAHHSKDSITLENCYSNLHTVYSYRDFVKMGLKKVARREDGDRA